MASCKDCYHSGVCEFTDTSINYIPDDCDEYTDSDLIVELPCKLGDPVFIIGGKYRAGRLEQWINPGKFRLSDLEKMGETVFLTREEAEAALAKMKGGEGHD